MFSTVADFSTAFAGSAAQVPAAAGAAAQVSAAPNVPFADGAAGGGAAAVDALTGVLGHGGGHSQTKQTKLGKLITDFLCNNNLWQFATIIGEMQYSCEILEFKNLKTRIARGQCFLLVTFKIAFDDREQEVTVSVRKNLYGTDKIICKREEFISKLALKVRPEGDRVTFNKRALALNSETFAQMEKRLEKERRKDPYSYPYVTAEQLLTYFLRCNPGTECPRGIHTKLKRLTDVPVTCPMDACGIECLCTEPLPGT